MRGDSRKHISRMSDKRMLLKQMRGHSRKHINRMSEKTLM